MKQCEVDEAEIERQIQFVHLKEEELSASFKVKQIRMVGARPRLRSKLAEIHREVRSVRDLYDFDNIVTAPLHGFRDTLDFWARASAKPHLTRIGVDEHAHRNARAGELFHHFTHARQSTRHIQAALGGEFLSALGHQHGAVGAHHQREVHHLVGGGHLEVQSRANGAAQAMHIVVLDVSAILSQMHGDAVCTTQHGKRGRLQQIGLRTAPRLSHGRHMIDVHAEQRHTESVAATMPPCPVSTNDWRC
jgi:hypothetical protein